MLLSSGLKSYFLTLSNFLFFQLRRHEKLSSRNLPLELNRRAISSTADFILWDMKEFMFFGGRTAIQEYALGQIIHLVYVSSLEFIKVILLTLLQTFSRIDQYSDLILFKVCEKTGRELI